MPVPDRTRYVAALLGGAMGDALGRPGEGSTSHFVNVLDGKLEGYEKWHGWSEGPIGTITDDTQLTMCVAECITTCGFLDPVDLSRRFIDWLPYGRGMGSATIEAVTRLRQGEPWWRAGSDSSGNGAAMRSAPIGLARWNQPLLLRAEAILSSLPTHRQPMGVVGAVVMAAGVALLVQADREQWSIAEFIAALCDSIIGLEPGPLPERKNPSVVTTLHDRIEEIPALLCEDPETVFSRFYSGAFVLESVPAALYCFLRAPDDVEEILRVAVNMTRDSDTVAAMAATLAGALGGEKVLPDRLLGELEYQEELRMLGHRLYDLGVSR